MPRFVFVSGVYKKNTVITVRLFSKVSILILLFSLSCSGWLR